MKYYSFKGEKNKDNLQGLFVIKTLNYSLRTLFNYNYLHISKYQIQFLGKPQVSRNKID